MTSSSPQLLETQIVGIDDGHSSIKTCWGFDSAQNKYLCSTIKSLAMFGRHQSMTLGKEATTAYSVDGQDFTFSGDISIGSSLETRFPEYPISPLNRVLVNHALFVSGLTSPLFVMSGLPVDQFYLNGAPDPKKINDKADNLLKPVTNYNPQIVLPKIIRSEVTSEGVAAFYDSMLEADGSINEQISEIIKSHPITVVDLGGKTLDFATIDLNGTGIVKKNSGTFQVGALDLKNRVAEIIKGEFDFSNEIPMANIDLAFKTNQYPVFGVMKDVTAIIKKCTHEYLLEVKSAFIKKVGDGSDIVDLDKCVDRFKDMPTMSASFLQTNLPS